MQVVLGNRGDYTVRAVLFLTRHPGRQRRRAIAEAMGIPDNYLPQILGGLVKAGVVRSTVGRHGGYELARAATSITLREVIEVGEGPIRSQKCVLRGGPCYWGDKCAIHDAWLEAEKALTDRLTGTTFADLAMVDWELEQRSPDAHRPGPSRPRIHAPNT
ncbi:MAG: Rrf2 family transcriptional regulator [Chloroflexota bacterium]